MATYQDTLRNEKTGEVVVIKSNDQFILQNKINRKKAVWEKQNARLELQEEKEAAIKKAENNTRLAQEELEAFRTILHATLSVNDIVDWNKLQDHTAYKPYEPKPKPIWEDFSKFIPAKNIFGFLPHIKNKRILAEEKAKHDFQEATELWHKEEEKLKKLYEEEKLKYLNDQKERNNKINKTKELYESGDKLGTEDYFKYVLEASEYPESLEIFSEVQYNSEGKILLLSVDLPHYTKVPNIKEYKYSQSKKKITITELGKKEFEEFYNDLIYQVTLRTIHEIFESDYSQKVEMVVFNGWVDGTDARTGKDFKNCIVSVQVLRNQFLEVNLEKITPQDCFRYLKGVSAGSLVNLAPVKPIMTLKTEDERIISADAVISSLDSSQNLATMDWKDFEVLVRDLISKEFSSENCKVEVTRASRDAGVDAIAFDQDPIRGGKYVIQAKRYNNLVPVSAVRDLYGTVMNEGAVKGILITTSYFGPDAIAFTNNKPITLINGEELLYMFNKHGYDFQIKLTKKQKAASSVPY